MTAAIAFVCVAAALSGVALSETCLYTVSAGESASSIAEAQGCAAADIESVNTDIADFVALEAGRILILPQSCTCPPPPACTVTVQSGDTAYSIAIARGCYLEDVEALNPGLDPAALPEGLELDIPTAKCRCSDVIVGCGWTVKSDESLLWIAAELHCGASGEHDLAEVNPGLRPDDILTGHKLLVPPSCDCPASESTAPASPPRTTSPPDAPVASENQDRPDAAPPSSASVNWAIIAAVVAVSLALLNVGTIAFFCIWMRRRRTSGQSPRDEPGGASLATAGGPLTAVLTTDQPEPSNDAPFKPPSVEVSDPMPLKGTETSDASTPPTSTARTGGQEHSMALYSQSVQTGSATRGSASITAGPSKGWVEMTTTRTHDLSACATPSDSERLAQHYGASTLTTDTATATQPKRAAAARKRPPAATTRASYSDAIEYLEDVLDELSHTRALLLERWAVLSSTERRIGGQGVVQFVWDTRTRQDQVIKFFLDDGTFQREAQLYARPSVREMMAAVVHMQEAGVITPTGAKLPSFIVLKKGSSLDEWAIKRQPDFATSLQVLMQIVGRLAALHEAGYVHRDLKPANMLWRFEDNDWTIIDFGCVADLNEGNMAPLAASLPYAPPEVARAIEARSESVEADPSLDMWSLGVVVYELLTQERLFPRNSPRSIMLAHLTGKLPLPWERGASLKDRARTKRLGLLKRSVLSLLSRDPLQRPTARALLLTLNALFQSVSSTE